MKVADLMNKRLITVSPQTPVSEVIRIVFNIGITGVPVVDKGILVGIVTEKDLLEKAFPSEEDFMQDWIKAQDYEAVEKNIDNFINSPVSSIMTSRVITVNDKAPVMHAQSLMILKGFSRLPVINEKNELVGIISQGDIFKHLTKHDINKIENAKYATFIGERYDKMVNWEKRFSYELPVLLALFEREKVKTVMNLGSWTGEYDVRLAKEGFNVLGVDENEMMIKICQEKRNDLSEQEKKRLTFNEINYNELEKNVKEKYDAVLCIGNSLPYIDMPLKELMVKIKSTLSENGIFVIQVLNFEKIIKRKNRLLSFNCHESENGNRGESMSLEFIRTVNDDYIKHNVALFDFDGKEWFFSGMTSVKVRNINRKKIEEALRLAGFSKITFAGNMGEYQGEYGPMTFKEPFYPLESDWLNVLARK